VTEQELAVARGIYGVFAETGEPPAVTMLAGPGILESLAERHVVVLDERGTIAMAHPFAAPAGDARVEAGGRTWWGSCAWDGLGIVAGLGLDRATVTSTGIAVEVTDGEVEPGPVFHVEVPARRWWDDIAHT
jgi:hypothetical protein